LENAIASGDILNAVLGFSAAMLGVGLKVHEFC
jgi:hypothetical protein